MSDRQQGPILAVMQGVIDHVRDDTTIEIWAETPPRNTYPYVTYDGYEMQRFSDKFVEGWDGNLQLSATTDGQGSQLTDAATKMDAIINALSRKDISGRITITGYTITDIQCTTVSRPERDYQADVTRLTANFRLRIAEA
jgi:hypothetical protein